VYLFRQARTEIALSAHSSRIGAIYMKLGRGSGQHDFINMIRNFYPEADFNHLNQAKFKFFYGLGINFCFLVSQYCGPGFACIRIDPNLYWDADLDSGA
jgi:hypothetical protein